MNTNREANVATTQCPASIRIAGLDSPCALAPGHQSPHRDRFSGVSWTSGLVNVEVIS